MIMTSSSSSSSATPRVKYDVFLSFRGEDTRNNFTSHLYAALCRKNIDTFIDDLLDRGGEISSSILKTIRASKTSIIIFSENYAGSRWCLRELQEILACKRNCGQIVVPVFYHVDPSHIRKQTGAFGKAFAKLQERFIERSDELRRSKSALKKAANLSGWPINGQMPENVLIEKIVGDILRILNKLYPIGNSKDLVGVTESQQKIESLLCLGSNGVRIIGIWGIGGIGKTTISQAVFKKILSQFESSYFTESVRKVSETIGGVSFLKKELFSTLLQDKDINVECPNIHERLGDKRVLIVFDDVTRHEQIKNLIEDLTCLHSRSRIIITSRDKQVLKTCGVEATNIYEVKGLCDHDSLQLFSRLAFRQNHPFEDFMEPSKKIVTYTQGVPLALKVLGSCLFDKSKEDWKSQMDKLEKYPHEDIYKVLKISYDGLDFEEKNIFLDIACFLKGWRKSLVQDILDASNFSSLIGIRSLIDKSLINIETTSTLHTETITMHDLLQEMGREIVRQESMFEPGKRSRMWHHDDIYNVLRRNKGTEAVQCISLDISKINEMRLNPHAFAKMHNLRFFYVYNTIPAWHGFEDLDESFSTNVFIWRTCPLKSLQFDAENLVILQLRYSKVEKLWDGIQNMVNLKHIDLGGSERLRRIPNLSKALNLQELILDGCRSLLEINFSSIENLNKLVKLDLSWCTNLISLPDFIQSKSIILHYCKALKIVPKISYKVEKLCLSSIVIEESPFVEDQSRLVCLDLSSCSCQLKMLPDNLGQLSFLQDLVLFASNLDSIPSSIKDLSNLRSLNIGSCKRLRSLPKLPRGIDLKASNCSSLESISDLSFLFSPELRPQKVTFANCFELNLSKILHKETRREFCDYLCYPGYEIPKWFGIRRIGSYAILEQLPDWANKSFIGFNICVVVEHTKLPAPEYIYARLTCHFYVKTKDDEIKKYLITRYYGVSLKSDHVFLGYARSIGELVNVLSPRDESYIYQVVKDKMGSGNALIEFSLPQRVKECGVHFLYAKDCEEPTERSSANFSSSNLRLPQLCGASTICDRQSSSFPWGLNKLPQDFDGSRTDIIATTNRSLKDYNEVEISGSGCCDAKDEPEPKRLKK